MLTLIKKATAYVLTVMLLFTGTFVGAAGFCGDTAQKSITANAKATNGKGAHLKTAYETDEDEGQMRVQVSY